MKNRKNYSYLLQYTLLFVFTCFLVFLIFLKNGKSFIWQNDGANQHYVALTYYGQYLRQFFYNLFVNHKFVLQEYSFSIGYGSPIITTLHYYVIGDPLTLLSVFVPEEYSEYLYNFLIILRLYLAGLSFSCFCFEFKLNKKAILLASLAYAFCGFNLYAAIRHPYFANPMIYFPLVLLAVEKLNSDNKRWPLALMVFIIIISNFYFAYMIAILTIIYITVRYFTNNKANITGYLKYISHFIFPAITGLLMAFVIFLPVVLLFISGDRSSPQQLFLYNPIYYLSLLAQMNNANHAGSWSVIGIVHILTISSLFLLGKNKGEGKALKTFLLIELIFLLFPVFGSALNGFNYVSNRWVWALPFLCSFNFAYNYDDLFQPSNKQIKTCLVFLLMIYVLYLFLVERFRIIILINWFILFVLLLVIFLHKNGTINKKLLSSILSLSVIFSIALMANYKYASLGEGYVQEFIDSGSIQETINSQASKYIDSQIENSGTIQRYENYLNKKIDRNLDLLLENNGTTFFWSLNNGNISRYYTDLCMSGNYLSYKLYDLNSRTFLNALASIRYFVMESKRESDNVVPYGYQKTKESDKYIIYENQHYLPLGYTYSSYIDEDSFNQLNAAQKQEALMQAVLLDEELMGGNIEKANIQFLQQESQYQLSYDDNIQQLDDLTFISTKTNQDITLTFDSIENSEVYLLIKVNDIQRKSKYQLYQEGYLKGHDKLSLTEKISLIKDDVFISNWQDATNSFNIKVKSQDFQETTLNFVYRNSFNLYWLDQEEFLINLGFKEEAINQIIITLPSMGVYSFSDIKVICQPMDNYVEQVNSLKEEVLENETHGIDYVSGTIDLEEDKILLLTIPYEKGWSAYVDGEKTEILKANIMFSALSLKQGQHKIELKYQTPGLRVGTCVSAVGLLCFIFIIYSDKRNKIKSNFNEIS